MTSRMSRRIDIELTSRTPDGSFTWRAAGAKQPKGTVPERVVPAGASVGDVVRAELESGLEGWGVVAITPKLEKADGPTADRIEVVGSPRRAPDVSVTYAYAGRRRRDDGFERRAARPPREGRGPGRDEGRGAGRDEGRPPRAPAPGGAAEGSPVTAEDARGEHRRAVRSAPARGERRDRPTSGERRPPRPTLSTVHRNALLGALGPQELPIAEQLLRGGLPAVRQAIAEQNAGRRGPVSGNSDAILAIAEHLLPRVSLASWKDRAVAAQAAGRDLRLRELRAVVTASRTVTLDDEARALARSLHESLDQRVRALREEWLERMTKAVEAGRVAEALATSARPPEPASRLPAELAVRLAEAAGAAMTADSDVVHWLAVLDAVVMSPVRRSVKPRGIPDAPEAQEAARHAAGLVPELARLLGLRIPPPPPPPRRPPAGRRVMAAGGAAPAGGR